MRSSDLRRGKAKPINLMGKELVLYRGKQSGRVFALDAYCPHMGAHLAEGRVENDSIRCFFHNWRYNEQGLCTDIPSMDVLRRSCVKTRSWHVEEKFGLIWLWSGSREPWYSVPMAEELKNDEYATALGTAFKKGCHPHVVLINAIDEQHFNSVHNLPVPLYMKTKELHKHAICFENTTRVSSTNFVNKILKKLYKNQLTYSLTYWNGSVGCVTLGPDFLHFYVMFALRFNQHGHTEGQTILLTKKRKGILGGMLNSLLLLATQAVAFYFAIGDTKVFNTIKFDLKTPLAADHAILDFIRHINGQTEAEWFLENELLMLDQKMEKVHAE